MVPSGVLAPVRDEAVLVVRPAPDPYVTAAMWVEAERVRRREVLVQRDGPVVCAQRRRDLEAEDRHYRDRLRYQARTRGGDR
jgi:hypothetical protein